jgi:murein DD-endopeptidase MepM/ murein hydrolase activator NlpD
MARYFTSGIVVLADDDPRSQETLLGAAQYADKIVALAPADRAEIPEATSVVHPGRRRTVGIDEAVRAAAQARIPWIAMRRDVAEPTVVLSQLLESAGRHASKDLPGFAAVLTCPPARPIERMLVIVDRADGRPSGLLVLAAVLAAQTTGAELDVLLLGAPGQTLRAPRNARDALRVTRDEDLAEQARRRAEESGLDATWIMVEDVADREALVLQQVEEGDYDLVVDDLGSVKLGGRIGRRGRIQRALEPGGPGSIARALLEQTQVPLAIVLDGIRLGTVPPAVVKGGAGAVLALGVVATATPSAGAASQSRQRAAVTQAVDAYQAALDEAANLSSSADVEAAKQEARDVGAAALDEIEEPAAEGAAAEAAAAADAADQPSDDEAPDAAAADDQGDEAAAAEADEASDEGTLEQTAPADLSPEDVAPESAAKVDADSVEVSGTPSVAEVREAEQAAEKQKSKYKKAEASFEDAQAEAIAAYEAAEDAAAEAEELAAELDAAQAAYEQSTADTEAATAAARGPLGVVSSSAKAEVEAAEAQQADALAELETVANEADQAITAYEEAAVEAAAAYEGLEESAENVTAKDAKRKEAKAEATATQEALASSRVNPVPGYSITTGHGVTGSNWSTGVHTGVDYAAPSGTEVVAAASGTVTEVSSGGAYGNRIVIQHDDGTYTSYSHLSSIDVSKGEKVTAGEHIGKVGSTGNSTGAHLHFEVTKGGDGWSGGTFLDPAEWLEGAV